jgi:hypothetical protein
MVVKLEDVLARPGATWLAMERYVNDGSPSGVTTTTSERTSPTGPYPDFELPFYSCPGLELRTSRPALPPPELPESAFPVHPDLDSATEGGLSGDRPPALVDTVTVTPTSSGRTVAVTDGRVPPVHIKLHYPRVIGRFARRIDVRRADAALDTSALLADPRAGLPSDLAFLPEPAALVAPSGTAAILRSPVPYPDREPAALAPLFSLFSRDRRQTADPPLLWQILEGDPEPTTTVWDRLLRPIVDGWAHMTLRLGLIPEWNAQNLLVELSVDRQIRRIVFRDLEGQHRDRAHRPDWASPLDGDDHRVLTTDETAARQQRSWLYDFKLGDYVLEPLVAAVVRKPDERACLITAVRERFAHHLDRAGLTAADLFPRDGRTYAQPVGPVQHGRWIEPRGTPPVYRPQR